ncbi:MAG: endonuclease [Clostridium sp.]
MRATLEIKKSAFDLYNKGNSAKKVAEIIGFNEATIRLWLKAEGIEIKKGGYHNIKYSKELIYSVIELYNKGHYTSEIDTKLKLRKGASAYILEKQRIPMRHKGPKSKILREDFFDIIDTEEKAYFLGYIIADGNVSIYDNQYSLKFHISIVDKEIVDRFLECIQSNNKTSIKNNGESYYVSLTSVHMCKRLIELGVIPNKTGKEIIPDDIPDNLLNHLIRGIFDGDGITDISCKRSGFIGSELLITRIKSILGITLTSFPAGKNKKVIYFLGGKKFSKKLYDYIYENANIYLKRKKQRLEQIALNDGTPYA